MLKIDKQFLDQFEAATLKTLKELCKFEARPEEAFFKGKKEQVPFEIAGIVGMTSQTFKGTISLCFPKEVFLKLMSGMIGSPFTEITKELEDGAAEILNIIFGNAKVALNEGGHSLKVAIPTVIRGSRIFSSYVAAKGIAVVLPFSSPAGEFYIEFSRIELDRPIELDTARTGPVKMLELALFQPFITQTITTIKTVANMEAKPLEPYYKMQSQAKGKAPMPYDIAGIIGITGKHINGSFIMCFEKKTFLAIISAMLGQTYTELAPEIEDGAAELVNIVFGGARVVLNENGYAVQTAIPAIIKGNAVTSNYFGHMPVMVMPFETPHGGFWIEFTYSV